MEGLLRLYDAVHPSFVFSDQSYNRFRGKPHSDDFDFTLNSHGFKDMEFAAVKPSGLYRILGIGDSFVFGVVPYRYNFLTLLEDNLNFHRPVEIVNMGIPAIGPREYHSLFASEGLKLDPDLVLVFYFIGNDILDGYQNRENRLFRMSYALSFFRFLVQIHHSYEGNIIHRARIYRDDSPTFTEDRYVALEAERSLIFIRDYRQYLDRILDESLIYLEKIDALCKHGRSRMIVVLCPDEIQVSEPLQTAVIALMARSPAAFDFRQPNDCLMSRFSRSGITCIDLLDDFRTESRNLRLYRINDSHWNIAGNALAADILTRDLQPVMAFRLPTGNVQ